jgi:hypothetical protein
MWANNEVYGPNAESVQGIDISEADLSEESSELVVGQVSAQEPFGNVRLIICYNRWTKVYGQVEVRKPGQDEPLWMKVCARLARNRDPQYDLSVALSTRDSEREYRGNAPEMATSVNKNLFRLMVNVDHLIFYPLKDCERFQININPILDAVKVAWELPMKLVSDPPCLEKDNSGFRLTACPVLPSIMVSDPKHCDAVLEFVNTNLVAFKDMIATKSIISETD